MAESRYKKITIQSLHDSRQQQTKADSCKTSNTLKTAKQ